jgi:hypothetical protein
MKELRAGRGAVEVLAAKDSADRGCVALPTKIDCKHGENPLTWSFQPVSAGFLRVGTTAVTPAVSAPGSVSRRQDSNLRPLAPRDWQHGRLRSPAHVKRWLQGPAASGWWA